MAGFERSCAADLSPTCCFTFTSNSTPTSNLTNNSTVSHFWMHGQHRPRCEIATNIQMASLDPTLDSPSADTTSPFHILFRLSHSHLRLFKGRHSQSLSFSFCRPPSPLSLLLHQLQPSRCLDTVVCSTPLYGLYFTCLGIGSTVVLRCLDMSRRADKTSAKVLHPCIAPSLNLPNAAALQQPTPVNCWQKQPFVWSPCNLLLL